MKGYKIRLKLITNKKKRVIFNLIKNYNNYKQYLINRWWKERNYFINEKDRYKLVSEKIRNNYHSHFWQSGLDEVKRLLKNKKIKTKPIFKNKNIITFTQFNLKIKEFSNKKIAKYWIVLSYKERGKFKKLNIPLPKAEKWELFDKIQKTYQFKKEGDDLYFIVFYKNRDKRWNENDNKKIKAIDIGYDNLFVDNEENFYGKGFKNLINRFSDWINNKMKKRNKLYALAKKYKEKGKLKKYYHILKFNLGKKKWNKKIQSFKQQIKTFIYTEINKLFKNDLKVLIMEYLKFSKHKINKWTKTINRRLSYWTIGLIKEAIYSKAKEDGVFLVSVNPSRTSIQCSQCGYIDKNNRKFDKFICQKCGYSSHSDLNASLNILRKGLLTAQPRLQKLLPDWWKSIGEQNVLNLMTRFVYD